MDKRKYMDTEEVQQLRRLTEQWATSDLAKGRRQGPLAWMLVDFALSTGLRVSEIAAVRVGQLDLKAGYATIIRAKKRRKTGRMVKDEKTGKDKPEWEPVRIEESLRLDKELIGHLRQYLDWRELYRPTDKADSLWIGKRRAAMTPQGLEVLWKRAVVLAGMTMVNPETKKVVARYSIHCARHTLATTLAKENPKLAQRQCGHSSVSTTLNMYCHVSDDEMAEALDRAKAKMK